VSSAQLLPVGTKVAMYGAWPRHGTGVLPAFTAIIFMRGITVGVIGTSSMLIAEQSGLPQNQLIAARGLGLVLGPSLFSWVVSRMVWCGESQSGTAFLLGIKALCEYTIPRTFSAPLLYSSFFILGLAMTMLDTTKNALVTRVFGEGCGLPLNVYEVLYGVGAMLAPLVSVVMPEQAWNLLVAIDLALAAVVAGKRTCRGKPRNWKVKVRGIKALDSGSSSPATPTRVPRRVLTTGLVFLVIVQACETAMSAWAFTYATAVLGLPRKVCATFPMTFYLAFTITRFVCLPLSAWLPPSTILQASTALLLSGATLLRCITCFMGHGEATGLLLLCVALVGVGTCPLYAMTLASIRRHGELTAQELGWYQTSSALGNTLGLWLPGLVSLPVAQQLWAVCAFLVISASARDFPWWISSLPGKAACFDSDNVALGA